MERSGEAMLKKFGSFGYHSAPLIVGNLLLASLTLFMGVNLAAFILFAIATIEIIGLKVFFSLVATQPSEEHRVSIYRKDEFFILNPLRWMGYKLYTAKISGTNRLLWEVIAKEAPRMNWETMEMRRITTYTYMEI